MKEFEILKYQNQKEVAKSGILGFFIGLAVILPGISGSTIAILFKLYDKLLFAIGNLFKKIKPCFLFLFPIVIGGILGLILGFLAIKKCFDHFPFAIMSLFGGLMIGALPLIFKELKSEKLKISKIFLFLAGLFIPIGISTFSIFAQNGNQSLENLNFFHYLFFIGMGFILAITQIVPGLSATAILMAFGYFKILLEAVSISYIISNPTIIGVFFCLGVGFCIGLITFSKFLVSIMEKHRISSYFMITGLSLGSIVSIFYNLEMVEVYQSWFYGNLSFGLDVGIGVFLFIAGLLISASLIQHKK